MICPAAKRRRTRTALVFVLVALPVLFASGREPVSAEVDPFSAPYELVRYGGDETLRDFVAKHLNDPDLWPTVLKINKMASPADLEPGAVLEMPVQQVALADDALMTSLAAIQRATAEGARLFAPDEIGSAINDRDAAVERRGDGEWREVVAFAGSATVHATEAFEIAVAQRDKAAEALITDIHGDVEGRDPTEAAWSDRDLNDILVEFERLRTLSNSTTQVTFRDLSRLRLNPNSNATIQRMRSDPLTGKEVTKVSLAEGDFYALLNQLSDRDSFEIDVPGIKTTTDSDDFWIKNDADSALFVNYDTAALDIDSAGAAVSLGQDEGVVIGRDGTTSRAEVLERTLLSSPDNRADVYGNAVELAWQAYPDAAGYWFEVAGDPGFNRMIASEWGVKETGFRVAALEPGVHFWRVAALDQLGLPGKWSEVREFELRIDNTPPFLTLFAPGEGELFEADRVELLGASESGVTLTLNGQAVEVAEDGSFLLAAALIEGNNQLVIVATDAAGNRSEKRRQVVYVPKTSVEIIVDPNLPRSGDVLVSRTGEMTLLGTSSAQAGLEMLLRDGAGAEIGRTRIGGGGAFGITVPVSEVVAGFSLEVLSQGGSGLGSVAFQVQRDSVAPEIVLDVPPPRATSEDVLDLTGEIGDAVAATLSGEELEIFDGFFATQVTLEPGTNVFEFQAEDAAGNASVLVVETVLDLEPPEILDAQMTRPNGKGGAIEIVVQAQDASGLRQAAPYLVEVGDEEFEGYLRCDSANGVCRANVPATPGEMNLIEVIVQDYAGNEAIR
ncbi:FecR domain-containing protein [Shimia abyssi]|uniref:FecR family protein n=1 Tax=Shimia abyssi TaxID=1662395 RepID=A0A2P8F5W8_9RHOB|nr:FecR domain-containing protein [Shimia abyssi]PSL17101.1 FecR family protein [Shimia abyssi]